MTDVVVSSLSIDEQPIDPATHAEIWDLMQMLNKAAKSGTALVGAAVATLAATALNCHEQATATYRDNPAALGGATPEECVIELLDDVSNSILSTVNKSLGTEITSEADRVGHLLVQSAIATTLLSLKKVAAQEETRRKGGGEQLHRAVEAVMADLVGVDMVDIDMVRNMMELENGL